MYTGKLYLDFEDDNEESHYVAAVTRCLLRENELVLEFSGTDEGQMFRGNCKLSRSGSDCHGEGTFNYEGEDLADATISLKLEIENNELLLSGIWKDHNDSQPYQLEADLQEIKYS